MFKHSMLLRHHNEQMKHHTPAPLCILDAQCQKPLIEIKNLIPEALRLVLFFNQT
jgi:hypothetical protein